MKANPITPYVLLRITIIFALLGVSVSHGWIDGTPYFFEGDGFKPHQTFPPSAPAQPNAPQLAVGDRRSFFAIDFRKHEQYVVRSTLRAIGKFCYVFVEDSQWRRTVNAATVEAIRRAFDDATPANPRQGIYQIETQLFGLPPDTDRDAKIYTLLLDIRDTSTRRTGFIGGFFNPVDQQRGVLRHPGFGTLVRSNERDMLYLDTHPLNTGGQEGLSVLAHEFQHLIHWRHDKNEEIWVNEGCSDYAMFICGYSIHSHVKPFERNSRVSLVHWTNGIQSEVAHYGAAYLWMLYLHEHYGGPGTIAAIVKHRGNGITSINTVLLSRGVTRTFSTIFADWKIANVLDDTQFANGQYGYRNERLNLRLHREHRSHPIAVAGNVLDSYTADYIALSTSGGDNGLNIAFEGDGEYPYDVKVIELQASQPMAIRNMPLAETGKGYLTIPNFGREVEKVILVPSVQPTPKQPKEGVSSYSYSTRRGEKVEFRFAILPNPVHPRYWDIIAIPGNPIGPTAPQITVKEGQVVIASKTSMKALQDGAIYTHPLYLSHKVNPEIVRWEIFFFENLVGTGDLGLK